MSQFRFAEVTARAGDSDVRMLLASVAWEDDPTERIERVLNLYQRDSNARLFAYEARDDRPDLGVAAGGVVACIGVKHGDRDDVELGPVAVLPALQRLGLGRALLDNLSTALGEPTMWAETDSEALGFYRKCGFEVESLGEKYPGVERFSCRRLRRRS